MWDVFISHASEDKDKLVRTLAKQLSEVYKVNVWYDEFSLEYGDSLLQSIEKGLQKSTFGLVIFSKDFFEKVWTDHECRGLQTKEMLLSRKVIIPIWYNINKDDIAKYSLTLADKLAINVNNEFDVDELAIKIIKIIRPDIYNNINRMCYIEQRNKKALKGSIDFKDISKIPVPPIRHNELSIHMRARLKLVYSAIKEVDNRGYDNYEIDFRRSTNIDREIIITELITAAYIDCISKRKMTYKERIDVYMLTLDLGKPNFNISFRREELSQFIEIIDKYLENISSAEVTLEYRF